MKWSFLAIMVVMGVLLALPDSARGDKPQCSNQSQVTEAKKEFLRMRDIRVLDKSRVADNVFKAAAKRYIQAAETCYRSKHGKRDDVGPIDDGGIWLDSPPNPDAYVTFGTKWGPDSPFSGGPDTVGPGTPGGEVTYSFMSDGVDLSAEGAGANVALSSLGTFSACFITEIENGFDAWAVVADISFSEVTDDGLPLTVGSSGDIRIGAHTFDGPSGTLAHGFFPPPNGGTAAGDIHFDVAENWDCEDNGSTLDIGVVAAHEIGHAIGLRHEDDELALMNPFYNPVIEIPLVDDIDGVESIYGFGSVSCGISPTATSYSGSQVVTIATMSVTNTTGVNAPIEWKVWVLTPDGREVGLANIGSDGTFVFPDGYFLDYADPDLPFFAANTQPFGTWAFGCRVEDPATGADYDAVLSTFETIP